MNGDTPQGQSGVCSTYTPDYQDNIWKIDLTTGQLGIVWVNSDQSASSRFYSDYKR